MNWWVMSNGKRRPVEVVRRRSKGRADLVCMFYGDTDGNPAGHMIFNAPRDQVERKPYTWHRGVK